MCMPHRCARLRDNIRMRRMKHTEAQGPVFARAQQNKLLKDTDEFCMQVPPFACSSLSARLVHSGTVLPLIHSFCQSYSSATVPLHPSCIYTVENITRSTRSATRTSRVEGQMDAPITVALGSHSLLLWLSLCYHPLPRWAYCT